MPPRVPYRHNFEALIDDLFAETDQPSGAPHAARRVSVDSLEATWDLAFNARAQPLRAGQSPAPTPNPYASYGDAALDATLDPYKIISELGLHAEATEEDVLALRRAFALRNHPDRVPAELRELATQRMMIANDLMDRYVAKLRKGRV
jgi:hypothetical protein